MLFFNWDKSYIRKSIFTSHFFNSIIFRNISGNLHRNKNKLTLIYNFGLKNVRCKETMKK